jgi:hypothetical protein
MKAKIQLSNQLRRRIRLKIGIITMTFLLTSSIFAQEYKISSIVLFPSSDEIAIPNANISGELRSWHKVTLTIEGPHASQYGQTVFSHNPETNELELDVRPNAGPNGRLTYMHPNPFLDYRMTVTFTHESGSPSYQVPGYFAADGNAAETSAMSGNKWRAHLSPDKTGRWDWEISFVAGVDISVNEDLSGQPYLPYHGLSGNFEISGTNKSFPDFRARGRLQYIGERYLRFAGNGEYFLKAGADSPETLLAYADFDGTKTMMEPGRRGWIGSHNGQGLHEYAAHKQEWKEGDPTWKDGKGRGLIGAINYLSSKGMNSMSFLTHTAGGDGENVWPWVCRHCKENYHVSKLDQWEIVFEHAQQMGLFLHFKLQEQENDAGFPHRRGWRPEVNVPESLDGGVLSRERKLYTREFIARFGHHLALNWNFGEETMMIPENHKDWLQYFAKIDPYGHHRVIHTATHFINHQSFVYESLIGDQSELTGVSLQTDYDDVHRHTLHWVNASRDTGKPWAVANDEQGPATWAIPPDPGFQNWDDELDSPVTIDDIRKYALWSNLMAGGWGVEYYFGYRPVHNDLVAEDWRSRDMSWNYARHAIEFFRNNDIPFHEMENRNDLIGNSENDNSKYCFAKTGEIYLIYLPEGGSANLDMGNERGRFEVKWYDPRNGGGLHAGDVQNVMGGGIFSVGNPPDYTSKDWLVVLRKR